MSYAPTFDVGDFVFVKRASDPDDDVGFYGYVMVKTDDNSSYVISPVARWIGAYPPVTVTCNEWALMHALYSFAGPVWINHDPR